MARLDMFMFVCDGCGAKDLQAKVYDAGYLHLEFDIGVDEYECDICEVCAKRPLADLIAHVIKEPDQ